ncbi:MAG: ATP-binding cassette domain-containing protein [Coriobacteriales bacterium]|jgi:lincosamide and streptogramin A transport system ATP-binding/permease protein|nr:ATP-binding cassette domain-containing protein [Coriobacteriales bacterium]
MSQIQLAHLGFCYEGSPDAVFEDVSVVLDSTWRLGLIGRNGRGKTTLLRLLAGELTGHTGRILSSVDFDYFPFSLADTELAAHEAVASARPQVEAWQIARELAALGISEDVLYVPYCYLSPGEQAKVQLAALFAHEGRFLAIDEPTNHLDEVARRQVSAYLSSKQGFILVSHDRRFLDNCIDHVMSINRTTIEVQSGNFSSWWENSQRREQFERERDAKLRKEVRRLAQAASRTASWSASIESSKIGSGPVDRGFVGHQSAKMAKRAKTVERRRDVALEERTQLLRDAEEKDDLRISPLRHHAERLVGFDEVTVRYGCSQVSGPVTFELLRGDRIAVRGANGTGKTSVLLLLLQQLGVGCEQGARIPPMLNADGSIHTASQLRVSYVSQQTGHLRGSLSELARAAGAEESYYFALLRKLGFERAQLKCDVSELSGGLRKKALIARSLCEQSHLYVWDEPLNYLDMPARMQVEDLLIEGRPSMLFIEHDSAFRERVATKELVIGSAGSRACD